MNDVFEIFWKEIRIGNRIIMPEGIQKITKLLLAV
jgi:hypothetical protein